MWLAYQGQEVTVRYNSSTSPNFCLSNLYNQIVFEEEK